MKKGKDHGNYNKVQSHVANLAARQNWRSLKITGALKTIEQYIKDVEDIRVLFRAINPEDAEYLFDTLMFLRAQARLANGAIQQIEERLKTSVYPDQRKTLKEVTAHFDKLNKGD